MPRLLDESIEGKHSLVSMYKLNIILLCSLHLIINIIYIVSVKWLSEINHSLDTIHTFVSDTISLINVSNRLCRDLQLWKLAVKLSSSLVE